MTARTLLLVGWLAVMTLAGPAHAQTAPTLPAPPAPTHRFGEQVTFEAVFAIPNLLKANVLVRAAYLRNTIVGVAQITPTAEGVQARYTLDTRLQTLAAFAPLTYWWEITTSAGETLTTPRQTWVYSDNRFAWRTLNQDIFYVHWHAGPETLGRRVLDAVLAGYDRARRDFPVTLTEPVNVYVYASQAEAQAVFYGGRAERAAAQTLSRLNLLYLVIPPDSPDGLTDIGRLAPHEVMHLTLGHFTAHNDDRLPLWLNEGLAVINQDIPNPYTRDLLQQARANNAWLTLEQLCLAFPTDPSQASLAYAQSEGVARYLIGRYGMSAVKRLITAYTDGLTCEAGLQRELNLSLADLHRDWLRANAYETPPPAAPVSAEWWVWAMLAAGVLSLPGLFWVSVRLGRGNTIQE